MDSSWWLYQCSVLELTDLMSSILPWSPWRISSLSAVLSGYANVWVRKLWVGEFKLFNSFNRHSSVQIYNEKKKCNWRTSLPTSHRSSWLSVRSDLPSRKWETLSIAPFHPANEERNSEGMWWNSNILSLTLCSRSYRVWVLKSILHFSEIHNNITTTCPP